MTYYKNQDNVGYLPIICKNDHEIIMQFNSWWEKKNC